MKRLDLTGTRFGRLLVQGVSPTKSSDGRVCWTCLCDCGNTCVKRGKTLSDGTATSCGCYHLERAKEANITHGMGSKRTEEGEHPIYKAWMNLRRRCDNPKGNRYESYGGRGITYDPRWAEFEAFRDDMLPTWKSGLSLERKDVNGNYNKDNCTWATDAEQMRNKTNNHWLEFNGKRQVVTDWAIETGIGHCTILYRLKAGWTVEETLTTPPRTTGR